MKPRSNVSAFLLSTFGVSIAMAMTAFPAFAITNDQQGCVNAINKAGAKVAATQGKDNAACVKAAGSGNLEMQTTDQCVMADNKGKVAGAETKTTDAESSKCSPPLPAIAFTGAATANTAAISEEVALLSAIYGSTVHTAMLTDHDGAACQAAVTKSYEKLGSTRLKAFNGCKKDFLKSNPGATAVQLQVCLTTPSSADPKGKVSGATTKLSDTVTAKCAGVALATAFPGCSAQAGSAATLSACVARNVECRMCLMTNAMDNLSTPCDQFDDGVVNQTCRQCGNGLAEAPEPCDTAGDSASCDSDCTTISCGDAHTNLAAGEACDAGTETAACDDDCSLPSCGDGNLNTAAGEVCDDGNATNGDGCDNNCTVSACGNGIAAGSEACDDGNTVNTDACLNTCVVATCGDGVRCNGAGCVSGPSGGAESCDDGNGLNTDNCLTNCAAATCGDGNLCSSPGCTTGPTGGLEQCDNDGSNSNVTPNACRTNCKLPTCGDGVTDAGEGCDDANAVNTDHCLNTCVVATCGDGVRCNGAGCVSGPSGGAEACDDANGSNTDSCLTNCAAATCGDGNLCSTPGCTTGPTGGVEQCDNDGSNSNVTPNACRTNCKLASCGDGVTDAGEGCDDGNAVNTDHCLNSCVVATCGDGVKCNGAGCVSGPSGGAEACDDGNGLNTDNCLTTCASAACGDGFLCSAPGCTTGPSGGVEQCDNDGSNSNVTPNACRTTCRTAFCGDNVTDAGETCDSGGVNTVSCDSNCTSVACGDGFINSAAGETCDGGGETLTCDANCTARVCGDGTINTTAGEICDDGNTASGDGCSSTCQSGAGSGESDPGCPNLGELVLYSHDSLDACTSNADCTVPRTCNTSIGYCTTVADLDSGWTGNAHNSDINDGVATRAYLVCEGPPSPGCGQCEVAGIDPSTDNCRCSNNSRTVCDEPFASAVSECPACVGGSGVNGNTCTSNTDCNFPTCAGRCSGNSAFTCTTNADCHTPVTPTNVGNCSTSTAPNFKKKCGNGTFCDTNADCIGTCSGQASCECFFGAPFPLNSAGTAVCVVNRFANDISGTANVDLGSGDITANLRTRIYLGITQAKPCPVCGGKCSILTTKTCANNSDCLAGQGTCGSYDPVASDGLRGGTCSGGINTGLSCDATATNATFPARSSGGVAQLPGGGSYSLDCMPSDGANVSGTGLVIDLEQTTGTSTLPSTLDCDAAGPGTDLCPCLQCSKDKTRGCSSDAQCATQGRFCSAFNDPTTFNCTTNSDCTLVNTGTCTLLSNTKCSNASTLSCTTNAQCGMQPGGTCTLSTCSSPGIGDIPQPNKCTSGLCEDIGDGFNGRCTVGPDQGYCDGLLRIDGTGMNACASNFDCTNGDHCTLSQRRLCFLDPIVAVGDPDPSFPIAGSTFCVPPTEFPAINTVAGLPGPGRVISQGGATTFCTTDHNVQYTPGGIPACP